MKHDSGSEKSAELEKPAGRNNMAASTCKGAKIAATPALRRDGSAALRSAQLEPEDLKDGLRLLVLQVF